MKVSAVSVPSSSQHLLHLVINYAAVVWTCSIAFTTFFQLVYAQNLTTVIANVDIILALGCGAIGVILSPFLECLFCSRFFRTILVAGVSVGCLAAVLGDPVEVLSPIIFGLAGVFLPAVICRASLTFSKVGPKVTASVIFYVTGAWLAIAFQLLFFVFEVPAVLSWGDFWVTCGVGCLYSWQDLRNLWSNAAGQNSAPQTPPQPWMKERMAKLLRNSLKPWRVGIFPCSFCLFLLLTVMLFLWSRMVLSAPVDLGVPTMLGAGEGFLFVLVLAVWSPLVAYWSARNGRIYAHLKFAVVLNAAAAGLLAFNSFLIGFSPLLTMLGVLFLFANAGSYIGALVLAVPKKGVDLCFAIIYPLGGIMLGDVAWNFLVFDLFFANIFCLFLVGIVIASGIFARLYKHAVKDDGEVGG
ncbi:MAG TPA: hypothetical protein VKK79_15610 [Candidatus Lokiarchaeia archaeon]|nr:hypothetical protein [Candidatus Lokiarchaeia archaeon]